MEIYINFENFQKVFYIYIKRCKKMRRSKKQIEANNLTYGEIMISAMIPISAWKYCKEKGWKFRELFLLGIETKQGMPNLLQRMNELEDGNKRLQQKLTFISGQLIEK